MRMSKERYPISTMYGLQEKIDADPDYQRPSVWNERQKQLLIDTILRGYDVPKMYWERLNNDPKYKFAVVDGQQRLRTVWEFCAGKFPLDKNADPVDGTEIAGKSYEDLDFDLRTEFDTYSFDVVIVEDAIQTDEEDEIRDMFLRLQNGTPLNAPEKRNAMTGQMRNFVSKTAEHPFFRDCCHFKDIRYRFAHVTAQMTCLEMAGRPTNIKNNDLNLMYEQNTQFDDNGRIARKVNRTLDYLHRAFEGKRTPELKEIHSAIILYCFASILVQDYVHKGTEAKLRSWFIKFEKRRKDNKELDEEKQDRSLIEYALLTGHSTDGEDSIRKRLEYIQSLFFSEFPDIEQKDKDRSFSHEQRLAIFRKDVGICQIAKKCDGDKLNWNEWHADHIKPHSKGGKTVVSNGQVACQACNLAKGTESAAQTA